MGGDHRAAVAQEGDVAQGVLAVLSADADHVLAVALRAAARFERAPGGLAVEVALILEDGQGGAGQIRVAAQEPRQRGGDGRDDLAALLARGQLVLGGEHGQGAIPVGGQLALLRQGPMVIGTSSGSFVRDAVSRD
jgi:hypothetical protein